MQWFLNFSSVLSLLDKNVASTVIMETDRLCDTIKHLHNEGYCSISHIDLKGFWRWCMLYRTIWLLLDSVHRLVCGSFTKDHKVSETGSVSVLRWMGQGRPTQLGRSKRSQIVQYFTCILDLCMCMCKGRALTAPAPRPTVVYCAVYWIYVVGIIRRINKCK
jgi:hypothetical protein